VTERPTRSLAEAGVAVLDCEHKTPTAQSAGHPYIAIPDIQEGRVVLETTRRISDVDLATWTRRTTPSAGDVVVTRRGRVGDSAPIPPGVRCAIGQNLVILRSDGEKVDQAYLRWAARSPAWWSEVDRLRNVGAVFSSLNVGDIGKVRLPFPRLSEQRAIAEVLGALDDKIAANGREESGLEGLIAALYARALKGSKIRTEPLLGALVVDFGEPFGGEFFTPPGEGRPLIRIRDLKTFESQVWTTESRRRETVVRAGDVVVGMDAEFRATVWLGKPGLLNQRVCRVRSAATGAAFVREALRAPLAEIEGYKSATTVIHLNKEDLARSSIAIPTARALMEFEAIAEPLLARRIALALERSALAATRDALLPALMSGALRVRDAERVAEESL